MITPFSRPRYPVYYITLRLFVLDRSSAMRSLCCTPSSVGRTTCGSSDVEKGGVINWRYVMPQARRVEGGMHVSGDLTKSR